MGKKRHVKIQQGGYSIALSRDLAAKEASERGEACLYCRDYYPNAKKQKGLSFVCGSCIENKFRY